MKELFKSDRQFIIFDYHPSHGQLLLRSSKNSEFSTNLDIIFYGVEYMDLASSLNGLSVSLKGSDIIDMKKLVVEFLKHEQNRLFEIISEEDKYLIGGSYFRVFENSLEFNETSLGLDDNAGRTKEIVSSL